MNIVDGLRRLAVVGAIGWAIALCGCQAPITPVGERVHVTQVVSGQALEVLDPQQPTAQAERVVLTGIAAPHWQQQPWSLEAKAELEALLGGDRGVLLESAVESSRQANGSPVRLVYVWQGNRLLNEQLVAAGWALVQAPDPKYQQRLEQAQETARLLGRGIWNPRQPMRQTPAEFRRQGRSPSKITDPDR